jgi:general secretion pathway protein G
MAAASTRAFTMVELIFVIVIVGILAGIAVPKLAASRDDAFISKARTTVGVLRSAISTERQKRILRGVFDDVESSWVEDNATEYGLGSGWSRNGDDFIFTAPNGNTCVFSVNNNRLESGTCTVSGMSDL